MCEVYVKVAGNWEQVNEIYVQVGGTWRLLTEGWQKVDSAWRIFWQPNGFVPFTQTFYYPDLAWEGIDPGVQGTVYAPCGATQVTVRAWGGGGSGGAKFATDGDTSVAGSGGGGAYGTIGPFPVAPNESFLFRLGGLAPPGSNTNPNPNYPLDPDPLFPPGVYPWFTQYGRPGERVVFFSDSGPSSEYVQARGGYGGTSVFDGLGGNQYFSPGAPNNGLPVNFAPASGFGGNAGGPGGGAGGQVNPYVPAQFPGGGGPGGFNGSDGHYGVTPVMYLDWS